MNAQNKVIVVGNLESESEFCSDKWITHRVLDILKGNNVKFVEVISAPFSEIYFSTETKIMELKVKTTLSIVEMVDDGDIIYFTNCWDTAIPLLKRHLNMVGMKSVKLVGLLQHTIASISDLAPRDRTMLLQLEDTIIECLDVVMVATEYGLSQIKNKKALESGKIIVSALPVIYPSTTGNGMELPVDMSSLKPKDPVVAFTNSWVKGKRPQDFIDVCKMVKSKNAKARFIVLHPNVLSSEDFFVDSAKDARVEFILCPTKKEYWENLVTVTHIFSSSPAEDFDYSVLDAVLLGAVPIVPNHSCYSFMYPQVFQYPNLDTAAFKILTLKQTGAAMDNLLSNCDYKFTKAIEKHVIGM